MHPIEVKSLSHSFGNNPILKDIEVSFEQACFTGIIGPNGSGKTTLIRNVLRSLEPSKDKIYVMGEDVRSLPFKELAKVVGAVPQTNHIEYEFSVFDLVLMGRAAHMKRFSSETPEDLRIAEEAMKETDVWHLRNRSVVTLSGGERQRVIIARAIAQNPKILILDEPVTYLDLHHQLELMKLLRRLTDEKGMTTIAILHDLNHAMGWCDRVMLMDEGALKDFGPPEDVLTPQAIKEVYQVEVLPMEDPRNGKTILVPA